MIPNNLLVDDVSGAASEWSSLQIKVGSLSPQYLNIGIVHKSHNGFVTARLLENFSGFKCLLGSDFNESLFVHMLEQIQLSIPKKISSLRDIKLSSPEVRLSSPGAIQIDSAKDAIIALWDEVITLDRHDQPIPKRQFVPRTTAEVRDDVFNILINNSGIKSPDYIQPNLHYQLQTNDNKTLYLDVPLVTNEGVGSLVSACYSTWQTIELNILNAIMDINAACKHSGKPSRAIFLKKPVSVDGISRKALDQIDSKLDEVHHKLNTTGIFMGLEEDNEVLADEIKKWALSH